ncbi:MAG: putative GNAT family acetyltransferase [Oleispira sp.]|jgi:predicted GNAT family acetyltransferase
MGKMKTLEHQIDKNRFILNESDNECVLEYRLIDTADSQRIDFTSTYVPFALRGQGLAEELVEVGLAWAKEQGYEIEASCWYVKKFL